MSQRKRRSKWFYIIGAVVFIIVAFGFLIMRWSPTLRAVKIPTHKLPSPNAYDYYAAAGKAIVDAEKIGYAVNDTPRKPGSSIPPSSVTIIRNGKEVPVSLSSPLDHTLAEKDAIIKSNAQALYTLRQGFAFGYREPVITTRANASTSLNNLSHFRGLSRLLVLESQTRAGHGDFGGAMDSCLDSIRIGEDLPRTDSELGVLMGRWIQENGRNAAWKLVDKLSADEANKARLRMESIMSRHVPLWQIFEEQKWAQIAYLQKLFKRPGWRLIYIPGPYLNEDEVLMKMRLLTVSEGNIIKDYQSYMKRLIKNAHLPYTSRPRVLTAPNDPVNQEVCRSYRHLGFMWTELETQNALLLVTLALRAYRLDHGKYPNTLTELVPSYLKKLPNDPFAAKGTLHYKRTGDKCVLYSIGPDGKDAGGKAIDIGSAYPSIRYWVEEDSKGDVVAGIIEREL